MSIVGYLRICFIPFSNYWNMRKCLNMASKMRQPQIEKNIFYDGPAGVKKQQGRAELLAMHKAFPSKGKATLLLHAVSSYGVWSKGLGGCDHAWKSSLYQVKNIRAAELKTSKCNQDFFFFFFALPVSFQVKAETMGTQSLPYIRGRCHSAVTLEQVPMSPACV